MLDDTTDRASFSAMIDGTADDYAKITAAFGEFSKTLPDALWRICKCCRVILAGLPLIALNTACKPPRALSRMARTKNMSCALAARYW